MSGRNDILELVYASIDEVNFQLPQDLRLEKSPDTLLEGDGAALDSLGLVNLIVVLEQNVQERYGTDLVLADRDSLDRKDSPFESVATVTAYVAQLLQKQSD